MLLFAIKRVGLLPSASFGAARVSSSGFGMSFCIRPSVHVMLKFNNAAGGRLSVLSFCIRLNAGTHRPYACGFVGWAVVVGPQLGGVV